MKQLFRHFQCVHNRYLVTIWWENYQLNIFLSKLSQNAEFKVKLHNRITLDMTWINLCCWWQTIKTPILNENKPEKCRPKTLFSDTLFTQKTASFELAPPFWREILKWAPPSNVCPSFLSKETLFWKIVFKGDAHLGST